VGERRRYSGRAGRAEEVDRRLDDRKSSVSGLGFACPFILGLVQSNGVFNSAASSPPQTKP
jgi:hypothetical protein